MLKSSRYNDHELKQLLLAIGYDVDIVVIRSWGSGGNRGTRDRVEHWLWELFGRDERRGGPRVKFPQFLASFDVRIRKHLEDTAKQLRGGNYAEAEAARSVD